MGEAYIRGRLRTPDLNLAGHCPNVSAMDDALPSPQPARPEAE